MRPFAPDHERLLFITDAAINIGPDLPTLADILQNASNMAAIALGLAEPPAAILPALETVTSKLPSALLAASICKMHDRGQITSGLVDGSLAFDNAISAAAVAAKGIRSQVAGQADILVAPSPESGNMIAKQLIHLANADAAWRCFGRTCPDHADQLF